MNLENVKSIRKRSRFLQYNNILKKNKVIFLCLTKETYSKKVSDDLRSKGFNTVLINNAFIKKFKIFKNVSSFFNGRLFMVYKSSLKPDDNLSLNLILNNFYIYFFSYNSNIYDKEILAKMGLKSKKLEINEFLSDIRFLIFTSFFNRLYILCDLYKQRRA